MWSPASAELKFEVHVACSYMAQNPSPLTHLENNNFLNR